MTPRIKGAVALIVLALAAGLFGCAALQPQAETEGSAISADGSEIRYGVRGQGDVTLVFIHCWTCSHRFWAHQLDHFDSGHRVVWLDLAGHGDSGSRRQRYTMQAFGRDVAAVVEKVGSDRVVLVGHSMGGPVAVEAARLLGDRVIGVVGVDTFYTPFEYPQDEAGIAEMVRPFETDFAGTTRQMIESMFTPAADPEVKRWVMAQFDGSKEPMGISALHELLRWNAAGSLQTYRGRLRNINAAPTGKEEPLDSSVVLIPGVGHFIPQVKPEEFNRALAAIVDEFVAQ